MTVISVSKIPRIMTSSLFRIL